MREVAVWHAAWRSEALEEHTPSAQIEPTPSFGAAAFDTSFILGVGNTDRGVIFLLDIGSVLSADEAAELAAAARG